MRTLIKLFSSPFIEERLYLSCKNKYKKERRTFSSPFIEERLYFIMKMEEIEQIESSRPLLSRSGCIYNYNII